jgi:hypothetical protein
VAISSMKFWEKLKKVMDVPENVVSFEMRAAVNEVVTVKCEFFPTLYQEGDAFMELFKDYYLCEREGVLCDAKWRSPYLDTL